MDPQSEREGSGAKRVCGVCDSLDEIRPGPAVPALQRESIQHSSPKENENQFPHRTALPDLEPSGRDQSRNKNVMKSARVVRKLVEEFEGSEPEEQLAGNTPVVNEQHQRIWGGAIPRRHWGFAKEKGGPIAGTTFDCEGEPLRLWEEEESDSDSSFDAGDYQDEDTSSEEGDETPIIYPWVEIPFTVQDVSIEVEEVDILSCEILEEEVVSVLKAICSRTGVNLQTLLEAPPSYDSLLSLFLPTSMVTAFAEMATLGLQLSPNYETSKTVSDKEMGSYIEAFLMCGIYDVSPSYLLSNESALDWYSVTEIRNRITGDRFNEIRQGLNASLGHVVSNSTGPVSGLWSNPRRDIPAAVNCVEQTVARLSSGIALSVGRSVLGIDDDHLRHASKYRKRNPFRAGDGKKGMGLHASSLTSTLSGMTLALHYSTRGESVPKTLEILLMLALRTHSSLQATHLFENSLLAIDRGYSTAGVIEMLTSQEAYFRFIATCKRSKSHPVSCGQAEARDGQKSLATKGMRELIVFERKSASGEPVFAIGYREVGNKDRSVLMKYSGLPLNPFQFSLKPRNRTGWKRDCANCCLLEQASTCPSNSWETSSSRSEPGEPPPSPVGCKMVFRRVPTATNPGQGTASKSELPR